jgi:hypothetical protein
MLTTGEQLIALLIAWTLAIGTAIAACSIAGLMEDEADAEAAGTIEIQQAIPAPLLPPVSGSSTARQRGSRLRSPR